MAFKKTELNDFCQTNKISVDGYETTRVRDGFVSVLRCGEFVFESSRPWSTKKEAENDVAVIALKALKTTRQQPLTRGHERQGQSSQPVTPSMNTQCNMPLPSFPSPDLVDPRSGQASSPHHPPPHHLPPPPHHFPPHHFPPPPHNFPPPPRLPPTPAVPYTAVPTTSNGPDMAAQAQVSHLLTQYCHINGVTLLHKVKDRGKGQYSAEVAIGDRAFIDQSVHSNFDAAKHNVNLMALKQLNVEPFLRQYYHHHQQQQIANTLGGKPPLLHNTPAGPTYGPYTVTNRYPMLPTVRNTGPQSMTTPTPTVMYNNQGPPLYSAPVYTPAYSQPAPMYTQPSPGYARSAPGYTQSSPAYIDSAPMYTQQSPMYSQPPPVYSHLSPVYSQQSPMFIQQSPAYTQPSPMYTQSSQVSGSNSEVQDMTQKLSNMSLNVAKQPPVDPPTNNELLISRSTSTSSSPQLLSPSAFKLSSTTVVSKGNTVPSPSKGHTIVSKGNTVPSSGHTVVSPSKGHTVSPNTVSSTQSHPPRITNSSNILTPHSSQTAVSSYKVPPSSQAPPSLSLPTRSNLKKDKRTPEHQLSTSPVSSPLQYVPLSDSTVISHPLTSFPPHPRPSSTTSSSTSSTIPTPPTSSFTSSTGGETEVSYKKILNEYALKHKLTLPVYTADYPENCVGYIGVADFGGKQYKSPPDKNKKKALNLAAREVLVSLGLCLSESVPLHPLTTPTQAMSTSYKNQLQEYCQKRKLGLPQYVTSQTPSGKFICTIICNFDGHKNKSFQGYESTTKKVAEQTAAQEVCKALKI